MILGIMQPYLFPYIGYFQLINAVDKFVFYDDVNFIKKGWINRNRIIINYVSSYFTIHLIRASQNKLINEMEFIDNRPKILKTIQRAYIKAPMYEQFEPIIEECFRYPTTNMSLQAMISVTRVCRYLGINTQFEISSKKYTDTKGMDKSERIKTICNLNNADTYINPVGGLNLYEKDDFKASNINLLFLQPCLSKYKQFSNEFIPDLSIIDIIMFNHVERIREMLDNYKLI